jgi:hypothetical protein
MEWQRSLVAWQEGMENSKSAFSCIQVKQGWQFTVDSQQWEIDLKTADERVYESARRFHASVLEQADLRNLEVLQELTELVLRTASIMGHHDVVVVVVVVGYPLTASKTRQGISFHHTMKLNVKVDI